MPCFLPRSCNSQYRHQNNWPNADILSYVVPMECRGRVRYSDVGGLVAFSVDHHGTPEGRYLYIINLV